MTSKELVRSSVYGFAFILGAFVATLPAAVFAAGIGSNVGFGAVLKFSTMLMPFSNTS